MAGQPAGVAADAFDHAFVVKDVDGNPHSYNLTYHPAGEGQRIMFQLMGLVAAPGSAAAGALLSGDSLADLDLGAVNWSGLGDELRRVFASEMTPKLCREILSYAWRDNVPLTAGFDSAYRANYGELLGALWEVIRANRFLSLPGMSLDGMLQQARATLADTAPPKSANPGDSGSAP